MSFIQDAADLLEFFDRNPAPRRNQVILLSEALRTAYERGNAAEPPTETLLDRWDEQDRKARDLETGREDEDGND